MSKGTVTDDVFTRYPNCVLDKLINPECKLTALERKIIDYIVRMTFGYHREVWQRSYRKMADDLGTHLPNLHEACAKLINDGWIVCKTGSRDGALWSVSTGANVIVSKATNASVSMVANNNKDKTK